MSDLYVAFMIITTQGSEIFEFDGDFFQQMDALSLINGRRPVVWFDHTQHRMMYRYDDEMKDAIDTFANKYGSPENNAPFRLRKFMKRLGKDEPFYMFRMEHYLVHVTQLQIAHAVYQLLAVGQGKKEEALWDKVKDDMTAFFNDYEMRSLGLEEYRAGDDSDNRVCRFCGKTKAEGITFEKEAHAISEALGNKTLFCNEECDCCNKRLATIEDNLSVAYLEIRRSLCGIVGKKGTNSVAGQNFVLDSKTHQMILSEKAHVDENGDKIRIRLDGREVFTFQGLYKALVKIVIDLVDSETLPHFKNTIEWINGKLDAEEFPPIKQMYCDTIHRQPLLEIFIRRDKSKIEVGPYCFANLYVCDLCLQFVVPFVDVDRGKMKSAKLIHPFEKKMGTTLAIYNRKYEWIDIEDTTPRTAWVELDFKKSDQKPASSKEPNISENLKMMPPKWETDTVSFPMFNPANIISSQLLICNVSNVNKEVKVTVEWLHDTSNNMICYFVIDENAGKVLVDIRIELCNTDNTEHLLDMRVAQEYTLKSISDVVCKEEDNSVSIQREFGFFVTAIALISLNPLLRKIHPLIDVAKLDLNMICSHYNCVYGSW